jgi:hypothetical protein
MYCILGPEELGNELLILVALKEELEVETLLRVELSSLSVISVMREESVMVLLWVGRFCRSPAPNRPRWNKKPAALP